MANVQCSSSNFKYNNVLKKCLSVCRSNMIEFSYNPSYCIINETCPAGTTENNIRSDQCDKIDNGSPPCADGSSEFVSGHCFVNCPLTGFTEAGTQCYKVISLRTEEDATCSNFLFYFSDGSCKLNLFIILGFVLVFINVTFIFKHWDNKSKKTQV